MRGLLIKTVGQFDRFAKRTQGKGMAGKKMQHSAPSKVKK
jgi:hypothetical protein